MKNFARSLSVVALLCFSCLATLAEDDANSPIPRMIPTAPSEDPTNAVILAGASPPPSPASQPTPPSSPGTETNFLAVLDDGDERIPPDVSGAVGSNHVMLMFNSFVRVQDRGGSNLLTTKLTNWWSAVAAQPFDPRVIYLPYDNKWVAVASTDKNSPTNAILVAVSKTDDPTGEWYTNRFQADPGQTNWADFPMVGFNKNWIVVTADMYNNTNNSFFDARIWVFNKTNLLAGGTNRSVFTDTTKASSLAPALTYDTNLSTFYLLAVWRPTNGTLRVFTITTNASGSPVFTATTSMPTNNFSGGWNSTNIPAGDFGPQTNASGIKIDLHDSRLRTPVIYRNGFLWCAHHVFVPPSVFTDRAAVQWWQIPVSNFRPSNVGRIEDTSDEIFYAYASIAVNRFDDVLIGYSRFGNALYASGNYSFRDACDSGGTLRGSVVLKAGETNFWRRQASTGVNRWGDYTSAVVDPTDDLSLWTLQQYAAAHSGGFSSFSGRWGTWWGKIVPAVFSNDLFASATVIEGCAGTNTASLARATREVGETNHAGNASTPSLWYRWTAPSSGFARFTVTNVMTCGSETGGVDTVLAVYTGSAVNALTLVTNRHGLGGTNVFFNAVSNTTYRVAVAGFGGRRGDFTLIWRQTNAPMIAEQPRDLYFLQGTNATFEVVVCAEPATTNQWRRHGNSDLSSVTNIAGATNLSFTLSNITTNDTGFYSLVLSNQYGGPITSRVAQLLVYSTNAAALTNWSISSTQWSQVVTGIVGNTYIVEATTNLINWTPIETNTVVFTNRDHTITNYPYRFYRVRTQ